MSYFSRRNECVIEYSGHEEVSQALRNRIRIILSKYVGSNVSSYGNDEPWYVETKEFSYEVELEFPNRTPSSIIESGKFHEVFTLVEIFIKLTDRICYTRNQAAMSELVNVFVLSGSVYCINRKGEVVLILDQDSVEKIDSIKPVFAPYPEFFARFYQAVGNLVGRRAKPEDIVKDIFVAVEGYLKAITGTSRFGDAIKELEKQNRVNKEQKKVLEALNQYASDASGARHAGNSSVPTEQDTLWFLDTLIAQVRMTDRTKTV